MKPVLFVNGDPILGSDFQAEMSRLRSEREAHGVPLSLEDRMRLKDEALEILTERTLLLQEARRLKLDPGREEILRTMEALVPRTDGVAGCRAGMDTPESRSDIGRRMIIDRLVEYWRERVPQPRSSEVRDYYRKNRTRFHSPEMLNGAHIVRNFQPGSTEDTARSAVEDLRARILQGEPFEAIATAHSDCPENGGDLGWFARGVMVEEFDEAVFRAVPGQLTPVFRTCFGFHFALIRERRPEGILAFEEVQHEINQYLWLARQDRELGARLQALRDSAIIGTAP